jgi:hypothetical protein
VLLVYEPQERILLPCSQWNKIGKQESDSVHVQGRPANNEQCAARGDGWWNSGVQQNLRQSDTEGGAAAQRGAGGPMGSLQERAGLDRSVKGVLARCIFPSMARIAASRAGHRYMHEISGVRYHAMRNIQTCTIPLAKPLNYQNMPIIVTV